MEAQGIAFSCTEPRAVQEKPMTERWEPDAQHPANRVEAQGIAFSCTEPRAVQEKPMTERWEPDAQHPANRVEAQGIEPWSENSSLTLLRTYPAN